MTPISLIFLGTPAFSCPALQTLSDDPRFIVQAVVTPPDRPAGRGKKLTPPPVRVLAEQLGIPFFQTPSIKKDTELQARLLELVPDFFVTVAFGQILTQAVLDIPKLGTVNGHASLLPLLRGANPIQQAVLQGHSITGMTTMLTELGVDTGPMLMAHSLEIGVTETAGDLASRLSMITGPLIAETLVGFKAGTVKPQEQPHDDATHAPKCPKELAILDWQEPAEALHRKVMAFNPAPGAVTFLNGERVKILTSTLALNDNLTSKSQSKPGEVVCLPDASVAVATGEGLLQLQSVQPAGKREMSAQDWFRGLGLTVPPSCDAENTHVPSGLSFESAPTEPLPA